MRAPRKLQRNLPTSAFTSSAAEDISPIISGHRAVSIPDTTQDGPQTAIETNSANPRRRRERSSPNSHFIRCGMRSPCALQSIKIEPLDPVPHFDSGGPR
jgi:hypothetical protein